MNRLALLTLTLASSLTIFAGCTSDSGDALDEKNPGGEETSGVIFQDDFDSFNYSVWTKETHPAGWTNNELQSYSPSYVSVGKDGDKSVLIITAEKRNGKIISGRLNSRGKMSFQYGKLEASIKFPKTANGLWPAFWLMGDNDKQWPACGEIDIVEMGDAEGISTGTSERRVNTALHYGADVASHQQEYFVQNFPTSLQDGEYHTYTMLWNSNSIAISIDGVPFKTFDTTNNLYFRDKFYILFNLAVGGDFTGITDASAVTALNDGEKVKMYVDWIKITE